MREIRKGDLLIGKDLHNKKVVVRVMSAPVDFGWAKSPYRAVNIETGEVYRGCNPNIEISTHLTSLACI